MPTEAIVEPQDPVTGTKRKLIYLSCEDAPKWEGHGEFWFTGMALRDDFEIQEVKAYEFPAGLPTDDELASISAMVISGSHYSVYEEHAWIQHTLDFIRNIFHNHTHIRVVAGCFGHQAVSVALGGKVGKNPSGKFVLGAEDVVLRPEALTRPDLRKALEACGKAGKGTVSLLQSHGDQVLEAPPNAIVLADSPTATYECLMIGERVLSWQGHPELTRGSVMEKIYPAITGGGRLVGAEADKAKDEIENKALDDDVFLKWAADFVRGN